MRSTIRPELCRTGLFTLRGKGKYLAPEQKPEYDEILKEVEEGVSRVKNIVSDLKTFTHPDMEQVDQVEVLEIVAINVCDFSARNGSTRCGSNRNMAHNRLPIA